MYIYHVIAKETPPVWGEAEDDYRPRDFARVEQGIYVQAMPESDYPPEILNQPEMAGATLIGSWHQGGSAAYLDEGRYLGIRPLGNAPAQKDEGGNVVLRAGKATGPLRYAHFAGIGQRELSAGDGEMAYYPESVSPVRIKAGHHWIAQYGGRWVLRCEVVGEHRGDVSVRQVDVYTDEQCKQFDYKIPAFTPQKSAWQVGDDGEPLDVWVCQAPVARGTVAKQALHFALVLDDAQEGFFTLQAGDSPSEHLFWQVAQES